MKERIPGFRFDSRRKLVHIEVVIPGSEGKKRRRRTEFAATQADALKKWSRFRDAVLSGHRLEVPTPSGGTPSLDTMARTGNWPTPTSTPEAKNMGANRTCGPNSLADAARLGPPKWPTPRAEDSESTGAHGNRIDTLTSAVRTWPTPTSSDANGAGSRNTASSSAHPGVSLTDAVRGDGGRGRVSSSRTVRVFPTPAARDGKGPFSVGNESRRGGSDLPGAIGETVGLKLNPRWVEWLMNFPIGWTSVEPLGWEAFCDWTRKTAGAATCSSGDLDRRREVCGLRGKCGGPASPRSLETPGRGAAVSEVPHAPPRSRDAGIRASRSSETVGCSDETDESLCVRRLVRAEATEAEELLGAMRAEDGVGSPHSGIHPSGPRCGATIGAQEMGAGLTSWWRVDPGDTGEIPRTTTGCPDRRPELRALGNGQVPRCAALAWKVLLLDAFGGAA